MIGTEDFGRQSMTLGRSIITPSDITSHTFLYMLYVISGKKNMILSVFKHL